MSNGVLKDDSFVIGWVGKDQYRKQNWKFWELLHYLIYGDYIICNTCKKVTLKEFDKQLGIPRDVGKLRMYRSDYDYSHCYYCNSQDITSGIPRPYIYGWSHMPFRPDDGWNPNQLGDIWKIRESVYQTANLTANTGVPTERMIDIYSVMDLFYCMSGGEGFGLPVAEAMACEIPVAYSNYSAHADIARGVGIEVETDFTCEMNSCFDRAQIKTADAIAKILPYIENRALLKELGVKARKKITTLNWDTIALQWENYIDNVAKNIKHTSGVIV
jgi:glycosyltransferase involved in cell wall biosynthesis